MSIKKNIKILELCHFTAGTCGVWTRVREESLRLSKLGYEIKIFSSNATKGSDEIAREEENLKGVKIKRFPFKKLGGEGFLIWNFKNQASKYSPDIIVVHVYRQIHTHRALKIAKTISKNGKKCKVILVTHAPFISDNSTRGFASKLAVRLYDSIIGPRTINKFDKIITISHWENSYLQKLGVKKEKIVYIPNGIPEEMFNTKKLSKEENKILFIGRISKIKNLEIPIKALKFIKDKKLMLEFVGPAEEDYKKELLNLIKLEKAQNRIIFSKPIYDLNEKIKKIDSCKLFVLPSKKEGMPQSLIEAMARSKPVLGSNIPAIADLIQDSKNGFLFKQGDEVDLANKINMILERDYREIKKQARASVKQFEWSRIINKLEVLFKN